MSPARRCGSPRTTPPTGSSGPRPRLQRRITAGVVAAGHPVRTAHAAVFGNIDSEGTRLTTLADRAAMTAQAMGELVDDLVAKGYLTRVADPSDRRAKLITLTDRGQEGIQRPTTPSPASRTTSRRCWAGRLLDLRRALRRIAAEGAGT